MDPVGKNSELNKLFMQKFASQKAREFVHPSQFTWVAHWMNLSSNQAEHKFKLPYLGTHTKRGPDQNPRSVEGNQLKESETNMNIAYGSDENDSLRDGHGLVEVLPSLLREKAIAEFGTNRSDVLFELVTRCPNDVVCPLPITVCPSNLPPPVTRVHSNPHESASPVISVTEMPEAPFSQKINKMKFASGQSSLSHVNAISDEINPFPLVLNERNDRQSGSAAETGTQLEDLETRSQQNLKLDIGIVNRSLFGAKLDENDFIQRTTDALMHRMLLPRESRPYMCNEDKNMQGTFVNNHEDRITSTHSNYFTNGNHPSVSSISLPCTEKKMKVPEHGAISHIHSLPGDFMSACTAKDEGRIIDKFPDIKFSGSDRNHILADMCYKSPEEMATFSVRDGTDVRISMILDEVKEVLGGPLNVLKTDQPYFMMKTTNVSLCKEKSVSNWILDAHHAFYRTADLFSSCFHDKRVVKYELSNKVSKVDVLSGDLCNSHCKASNNAEDIVPGRRRSSSPMAKAEDATCVGGSCYEACIKNICALPIPKEDDQYMNDINGTKISADVQLAKKSKCCDIRSVSSKRGQLDLNTDPENSGQTVDTIDKDFVDVDTCEHYHLHNERKSLNSHTKVLSSNTELDPRSNLSGHVPKMISASNAHELNSRNQFPNVDWTGSSSYDAGDMDLDPRTRWVKRLKHSLSEAFGTKSSMVEDISDQVKRVELFNKLPKYDESASKPAVSSGMCELQRKSEAHGAAALPRKTKSAAEVISGSRGILSNPWIKRLCPSEFMGIQLGGAAVGGESRRRKVELGMQAEEFPSIGAMTLMGKVLCNFRPRSFAKTGSSTV